MRQEKERYKQLWRISCDNLAEHDAAIAAKDGEIATLQGQLHADGELTITVPDSRTGTETVEGRANEVEEDSPHRRHQSHIPTPLLTHPIERATTTVATTMKPRLINTVAADAPLVNTHRPHDPTVRGLPHSGVEPNLARMATSRMPRRQGKAPPVDPFTGEDPEIRFEDWLPALVRASQWNEWTSDEILMQLAGHLRGRALQEWGLLEDKEKSNWDKAVLALHARLDPRNKVLAAQDFRHTIQKDLETVADFTRRLERTFRIAYGSDHLSRETREAFLYAQLQDGLRPELMQNSAVSGALTYKELYMAARNEEQRRAEMKKRRQYWSNDPGDTADQRRVDNKQKNRSYTYTHTPKKNVIKLRQQVGDGKTIPTTPTAQQETRSCYNCGKTGHLARDCRIPKTESQGYGHSVTRRQSASAKQVSTTATDTEKNSEDPFSYLLSDSDGEESEVKLIQLQDKGSQPQCAQVIIGGVSAWGIVDSGADITIIGKELFKMIASVCKLKKKDFKKPDKIPKTYDRTPFSLNGRIELEITFEEKKMVTTVYVKMDAYDQLLLSEGVCRQLGILHYHPSVRPWVERNGGDILDEKQKDGTHSEIQTEKMGTGPRDMIVPTVRVKLLQALSILPLQRKAVKVEVTEDGSVSGPLLLEPLQLLSDVVTLEPSLLEVRCGIACIELTNRQGYTQHLDEGLLLGEATEAEVVLSMPDEGDNLSTGQPVTGDDADNSCVRRVQETKNVKWRKEKISELFWDDLNLGEEHKKSFCEFLMQHHLAFSLEDGERGETDLLQLEIDTGEALPKKQRLRRMPFPVREEVSKQLQKMQDSGVIQPSTSPWASPVVLVRKKDGTHRFCVDYRELNSVTKQDTFPLPRVDDLLDQLGETCYFSSLDLASGYWQIKVHPQSQAKTAFVTHRGLHEFRVMPFGLTNAPAVFQRLMQQVLMGLNPNKGPDFVSVYIDDILVFSRTLEEHLQHLKKVLSSLAEVGLKLKPAKCQFIRQEVDFLGHVITPQGLRTSQRHVAAITEFPVPKSVTEVRRFMGLASYYRRFVKCFAKIAQPLHALTRKGVSYIWSESCQRAFEELKNRLSEAPILAYPSFVKDFTLETDASIQGIGAVLSQYQENGKLHPVAFASRAVNPTERNYSITDLETLAVVWAVSHFRTYLYGQKVTIYTDHAAVKAVLQNPEWQKC